MLNETLYLFPQQGDDWLLILGVLISFGAIFVPAVLAALWVLYTEFTQRNTLRAPAIVPVLRERRVIRRRVVRSEKKRAA